MKKKYGRLIFFTIFIILFGSIIFFGSETRYNCKGSICEACLSSVINPVARPISFALLNLPNAIKGKSLSSGCDEIIAGISTILDIVCAIFISIMLKEIIVLLCLKYFKNQEVKAETTTKDKIKISIISFILIAYLILIIINTIAYSVTPKFIFS